MYLKFKSKKEYNKTGDKKYFYCKEKISKSKDNEGGLVVQNVRSEHIKSASDVKKKSLCFV